MEKDIRERERLDRTIIEIREGTIIERIEVTIIEVTRKREQTINIKSDIRTEKEKDRKRLERENNVNKVRNKKELKMEAQRE